MKLAEKDGPQTFGTKSSSPNTTYVSSCSESNTETRLLCTHCYIDHECKGRKSMWLRREAQMQIMADTFSTAGCIVSFAAYEADQEAAFLCAKYKALGILSPDSDTIIFPGVEKWFLCLTANFKSNFSVEMVAKSELRQYLQLPESHLPLLSCLAGNDYITSSYQELCTELKNYSSRDLSDEVKRPSAAPLGKLVSCPVTPATTGGTKRAKSNLHPAILLTREILDVASYVHDRGEKFERSYKLVQPSNPMEARRRRTGDMKTDVVSLVLSDDTPKIIRNLLCPTFYNYVSTNIPGRNLIFTVTKPLRKALAQVLFLSNVVVKEWSFFCEYCSAKGSTASTYSPKDGSTHIISTWKDVNKKVTKNRTKKPYTTTLPEMTTPGSPPTPATPRTTSGTPVTSVLEKGPLAMAWTAITFLKNRQAIDPCCALSLMLQALLHSMPELIPSSTPESPGSCPMTMYSVAVYFSTLEHLAALNWLLKRPLGQVSIMDCYSTQCMAWATYITHGGRVGTPTSSSFPMPLVDLAEALLDCHDSIGYHLDRCGISPGEFLKHHSNIDPAVLVQFP
ncbi:hypothetical protein Pelo_9408 [Pelomyxa schiedti]|nr:hypothetical protein Pelo_9408 [Pelomyxa schiedti]